MTDVLTKRELTPESFASFLAWLSPDPADAGLAYERLRYCLSTFFFRRQCRFADELADETINRVVSKISAEPIANKMGFCYGVAKNVYRESLRKERVHVDIDEVNVAAQEPEEPSFSHECLDKCLGELPAESRNLLLSYFSEVKQRKIEIHKRIAAALESSQTALRMRVMREKKKLKLCVEQCMNS